MVETLSGFPVNELGEILVTRGSGTNLCSGINPTGVPSETGNSITLIDANIEKVGGWKFIQDGRYTVGSPLLLLDGVKTKITFDLSQLSYSTGEGLTLTYNQALNKFMPQIPNSVIVVSFRGKFIPAQNGGSLDWIVESPGFAFNPIVGQTGTFNKSGVENFATVTELLFIDPLIIANGLEMYITARGSNVQMYDYSLLAQRTYIP